MNNRFIKLVVFLCIVILFSICNYCVFLKINTWMNLGFGDTFQIVGFVVGFCSFFALIWQHHFSRLFYKLATYWVGIIFISMAVVFICYIFQKIFFVNTFVLGSLALFCIISLTCYAIGHANRVFVKNLRITNEKIKERIRIAFIADTHINLFSKDNYLGGLLQKIRDSNPDILLIGGDFADGMTRFEAISVLKDLKMPIYLSMGNHEIWASHRDSIVSLFERVGIKFFDEKVYFRGINIFGVDFGERKEVLKENIARANFDLNEYNVFIYHDPREVELVRNNGVDLMLSGHTHAGQIFPWNLLVRLFYKYFYGLYENKGMKIRYVWGPSRSGDSGK